MKNLSFLFIVFLLSFFFNLEGAIANSGNLPESLNVKLSDTSNISIKGPYRFLEISGIKGLHVTSLHTQAVVETSALNKERGTISIWMSPLETMNKANSVGKIENIMTYPLISDIWPPRNYQQANFSLFYRGFHYPRLIAGFTDGSFWGQMDFGMAPYVYAEDLPLEKGQWYNITVTWDKSKELMVMYINGIMVGHNYLAKAFKLAGNNFYIGNPLMVVSNLNIVNEVLDAEKVRKEYLALRPAGNNSSEDFIKRSSQVNAMPENDIPLDNSWEKVYECAFNRQEDLNAWTLQTGDLYRDLIKTEITEKGLYWETPNIIHKESRAYLWSPVNIEGDQWIEFDFQLVSPKGLALVVYYASGIQGEDVITDHGLVQTGAMAEMNGSYRNYHWEFMRRVEAMRTDVETQYVNKNPWGKSIYIGCVPRFDQNRWYKLGFIKKGNRLVGLLDGKVVFDYTENPKDNFGPSLNSGRVVLRQMYNTTMIYRNFVIYRKTN